MSWQEELRKQTLSKREILRLADLKEDEFNAIDSQFPIRVLSSLLTGERSTVSAITKQFLPSREELRPNGLIDPLQEEQHRKNACIIHRYKNRVLFLVSNTCASYCRFCTRRRVVGKKSNPTDQQLREGFEYLEHHKEVDEVILSGGDPLMLSDRKLGEILSSLRKIKHVEVIRLATRMLVTLPERIHDGLIDFLNNNQPLYIITQINHPLELRPQVDLAIKKLTENGIPILNQSVLLKGVNDDPNVMLTLIKSLIVRRIRPYYVHQLDAAQGTTHFAVPIEKGRAIMRYLRENIGGFAVPLYVYDDPKEKSKVMLYP